jgi:hypothetical protein
MRSRDGVASGLGAHTGVGRAAVLRGNLWKENKGVRRTEPKERC